MICCYKTHIINDISMIKSSEGENLIYYKYKKLFYMTNHIVFCYNMVQVIF